MSDPSTTVSLNVLGGITYYFVLAPQVITPSMDKGDGVSPMAIPGNIRPMAFDSRSQSRSIKIDFTLMSLYAYTTPGTGSILDQIADLELIADSVGQLVTITVPYPAGLTVGHSMVKSWLSGSPTWSECGTGLQFDPAVNYRRFFATVQSLSIPFDSGGVIRQRGSISFMEVDPDNLVSLV